MRLLIFTQAVDKQHSVVGFFHDWVEEFAKHAEEVTVICLQKGDYDLPSNVRVLSLGKERYLEKKLFFGRQIFLRLKYTYRFYKYIWRERKNYDAVFVHMNQEYVLLGGLFWRIFGKRSALWYNHEKGTIFTRIAMKLVDHIFHTSAYAFTAGTDKSVQMPAGIDVSAFQEKEGVHRDKQAVLFVGRLSLIKRPDLLISAVTKIYNWSNLQPSLTLVGEGGGKDALYVQKLHDQVNKLKTKDIIKFQGKVPHRKLPSIYSEHAVYVNLSPSGLFDKTILEAAACGTLVLVSSRAFRGKIPEICFFAENDKEDLAKSLQKLLMLPEEEKKALQKQLKDFAAGHSLSSMATTALKVLS